MTSRSRSISRAAAMSIDRTTSANSAVTCLYSADRLTCVTGAPHSLQNFELAGISVPHDPHDSQEAVIAPRPSSSPPGSTSLSCHRWSDMSPVSPAITETYPFAETRLLRAEYLLLHGGVAEYLAFDDLAV